MMGLPDGRKRFKTGLTI